MKTVFRFSGGFSQEWLAILWSFSSVQFFLPLCDSTPTLLHLSSRLCVHDIWSRCRKRGWRSIFECLVLTCSDRLRVVWLFSSRIFRHDAALHISTDCGPRFHRLRRCCRHPSLRENCLSRLWDRLASLICLRSALPAASQLYRTLYFTIRWNQSHWKGCLMSHHPNLWQ